MDNQEIKMRGKKYWYLYTTYYCPACGSETTYKERQYTPKPKSFLERHVWIEYWDGCGI